VLLDEIPLKSVGKIYDLFIESLTGNPDSEVYRMEMDKMTSVAEALTKKSDNNKYFHSSRLSLTMHRLDALRTSTICGKLCCNIW
jgi:hypothetical protein